MARATMAASSGRLRSITTIPFAQEMHAIAWPSTLNERSHGLCLPIMEMEKLVSLCKRRGFLFPSSEIYGGLNGFWDYGPLGVEFKRNIREAWWRDMVTGHDDLATMPGAPEPYEMTGLDCTIIMHPQVWKCSGHYDLFHDMMVDCRECKARFRADHLTTSECPRKPSRHPGEYR